MRDDDAQEKVTMLIEQTVAGALKRSISIQGRSTRDIKGTQALILEYCIVWGVNLTRDEIEKMAQRIYTRVVKGENHV